MHMSLLNVWVRPHRALIAVDTAAFMGGEDGEFSKLLPISHARTLFAARGDRRFLWDLHRRCYLGVGTVDYDTIVEWLPHILKSMLTEYREAAAAAFDFEFCIVGWSPANNEIRGRFYHGSTGEDFYDEDDLGQRIGPWTSDARPCMPDSIENMQALATQQIPMLATLGGPGGGKLLVVELTERAMTTHYVCDL